MMMRTMYRKEKWEEGRKGEEGRRGKEKKGREERESEENRGAGIESIMNMKDYLMSTACDFITNLN